MPLSGVVENTGTIALDSTGAGTEIQIVQHGITLEGGGSLRLSDSSANVVNGTSSAVVFTNVDNTISGAGHLGEGQLTLVNHGTIIASGANALEIDTGANVVFNSGTLEATGTGGLAIDGNLWNTGILWANNGNITVEGNVSGDGSAHIDGVAAIELGGLFAETITINLSAAGTLVFDHASEFSGAVVGFNDNDQLQLADISATNATLNYTANATGTGGVLSVSDGTHTANIQLQGQYAADDFHSAADPDGGQLAALATAGLGLPLLLSHYLALVLAGMVLVAAGTFFAQALATGFVSHTAMRDRSAASGIYLASYFIGGLVGTAVLGQIFDRLGWPATVAGIGLALALAAFLSLRLHTAQTAA